ncbi:hypothetical protein ACH4U6_35730 [Streptomyces netropsis]|uniref:hypothetical protein n=1 Tax=Streptomyces netropsis TaxID=55404 RepID=UPI00378E5823
MNNGQNTVTVHTKALRTSVHDITLTVTVPSGITQDPAAALLLHLSGLDHAVTAAACTGDTVNGIDEIQVLDILSVLHTAERSAAGGEESREDR